METKPEKERLNDDVSVGSSRHPDPLEESIVDNDAKLDDEAKGDGESLEEQSESGTDMGTESGAAVDTTRFPWKLHRMLTEIEQGDLGLEDIVSWQPHGRGKVASHVAPSFIHFAPLLIALAPTPIDSLLHPG